MDLFGQLFLGSVHKVGVFFLVFFSFPDAISKVTLLHHVGLACQSRLITGDCEGLHHDTVSCNLVTTLDDDEVADQDFCDSILLLLTISDDFDKFLALSFIIEFLELTLLLVVVDSLYKR